MANYPRSSQKSRNRRKLPNIHQMDNATSTPAMFWYSYQSALTWIRQHEDITSKCVKLLQIYPNLIQDPSMDNFWDFIQCLVQAEDSREYGVKGNEKAKSQKDTNSSRHRSKEGVIKGHGIPHISVTETNNTPGQPVFTILADHARTPRVHLISRGQGSEEDRLLHSGVLDMLQEDFYIRTTKQPSPTEPHKESQRQYVIAESDICIYLFNDATLEDTSCLHDLCIALARKIPIVYIRYHKKELPKTLPETISTNSKGCITLKDYIEKFLPETRPASSSTLTVKNNRLKNKLAPLKVGNRSKSASELNIRQIYDHLEKHKRSSVSIDIDLLFTLVNNFKTSCVFDETDSPGCSSRLKYTIRQLLGICDSKAQLPSMNGNSIINGIHDDFSSASTTNSINNKQGLTEPARSRRAFLSVPDPEDLISTREWGNSGSVSAPLERQSNHELNFERNGSVDMNSPGAFSPTLEQRATTYLIFDHSATPVRPRKVDFPTETDNELLNSEYDSDECLSSLDSPINFQDIDLAREINNRGTPESVSSVF